MKPIVYGNVARYFGKKREEDGHTHSWSCYLRPFKNEVNIFLSNARLEKSTEIRTCRLTLRRCNLGYTRVTPVRSEVKYWILKFHYYSEFVFIYSVDIASI